MMSGAQKPFPCLSGTALATQAGALVKTTGPLSQTTKSFEWHEGIPRPVKNSQYSLLHLTMVDGSWTLMSRLCICPELLVSARTNQPPSEALMNAAAINLRVIVVSQSPTP